MIRADRFALQFIQGMTSAFPQRYDLDAETVPVLIVRIYISIPVPCKMIPYPLHDTFSLADIIHILVQIMQDVHTGKIMFRRPGRQFDFIELPWR